MKDFPFHKGGTKKPSLWSRLWCEWKYGEHYYMTPSPDVQAWCGRCGKFDPGFVSPKKKVAPQPVILPMPPEMVNMLNEVTSMLPHPHQMQSPKINKTLKDTVVWLVDEYRQRKHILPHVSLSDVEIDELMGGIHDLVLMYEGSYDLPGTREEEDDEDNDDGLHI